MRMLTNSKHTPTTFDSFKAGRLPKMAANSNCHPVFQTAHASTKGNLRHLRDGIHHEGVYIQSNSAPTLP